MFTAISLFVRQWFNALAKLGSAAEHAAGSIEFLAITAEETAGCYCDEARSNRAAKMSALNAEMAVAEKQSIKAIKAA